MQYGSTEIRRVFTISTRYDWVPWQRKGGCVLRGQFFLRLPDGSVEQQLKLFTLLPLERIKEIMHQHEVNYLALMHRTYR